MKERTTCLDAAAVRRLLVGALADEEEERLAEHLDGCPGCRQVLDQAAGGPPREGPWAVPAPPAPLIDDALRQAMIALKSDTRPLLRPAGPGPQDTAGAAFATDELPRPQLGHYQVTEVIGRGGFGVVFPRLQEEFRQRHGHRKARSPAPGGSAAYGAADSASSPAACTPHSPASPCAGSSDPPR